MTLKHNQSLGREPWISLKPRLITSLELRTSVGVCPTKFKSRRSHCHSDQQRSTLIRGSQSYLKKCAVRQKSYYIYFLIFFWWLLELARSVYQNNSYGKCVTKTRSQVPAGEAQLQQLLYLLSVDFTDAPDSSTN